MTESCETDPVMSLQKSNGQAAETQYQTVIRLALAGLLVPEIAARIDRDDEVRASLRRAKARGQLPPGAGLLGRKPHLPNSPGFSAAQRNDILEAWATTTLTAKQIALKYGVLGPQAANRVRGVVRRGLREGDPRAETRDINSLRSMRARQAEHAPPAPETHRPRLADELGIRIGRTVEVLVEKTNGCERKGGRINRITLAAGLNYSR